MAKNIPTNPELYARVKAEAKAKFDVYPSAYANGWIVQEYKRRGGKYRVEKSEGGLGKWFDEKWVDLSRPKKGGGFEPCGRKDADKGKYPKCVPASRAAKMTEEEIRSAVRRKRRAESTQSRDGKKPINVSTFKDTEKGRFPSRSEAGRFAAQQRWGQGGVGEESVVVGMHHEHHPPALAPDIAPDAKHGERAAGLAARIRARSEALEPAITQMMMGIALFQEGEMVELDQRLKSTQSLARKIHDEAITEWNGDEEAAAESISDSIRYTMVVSGDRYLDTVQQVIKEFEGDGFAVKTKNYWQPGDPFDAMLLKLTKDGITTEFQILTPEAKKAKLATHDHYKVYRDISQPMSLRKKAWEAAVAIAKKTPRPVGIGMLLTIGTLILEKPEWAL